VVDRAGLSRVQLPPIALPLNEAGRDAVMAIIIEIRAAEGGDDAKLLVKEQLAVLLRRAQRRCL
jgi:protein subunit release factor A